MMNSREELLIKTLNEKNYKVGVEVGTYEGALSSRILNEWNGTLYMVDVWRKLDEAEYEDASNADIDSDVFKRAMVSIRGLEDRGLMLRMKSTQAARLFADESLDFIYIDANHKYDFVCEDLETWWPKLKRGGLFSGHDYMHEIDWSVPPYDANGKDKAIYLNHDGQSWYAGKFGVQPAVDEFAERKKYEVQYTNEWLSSWYFFKR